MSAFWATLAYTFARPTATIRSRMDSGHACRAAENENASPPGTGPVATGSHTNNGTKVANASSSQFGRGLALPPFTRAVQIPAAEGRKQDGLATPHDAAEAK
jgi:hypothetical protein